MLTSESDYLGLSPSSGIFVFDFHHHNFMSTSHLSSSQKNVDQPLNSKSSIHLTDCNYCILLVVHRDYLSNIMRERCLVSHADIEDSDHPVLLCSLNRVLTLHNKLQRLSDWTDMQAGQSLHSLHVAWGTFSHDVANL